MSKLVERFSGLSGDARPVGVSEAMSKLAARFANLKGEAAKLGIQEETIKLSARLGGIPTSNESGPPKETAPRLADRLKNITGAASSVGVGDNPILLGKRLADVPAQQHERSDPAQPPMMPRISDRVAQIARALPGPLPMEDVFLPFGEWLPDLPEYKMPDGGLVDAKNVVPVAGGYGPIQAAVEYSTSELNERPQGAFACQDDAGNVYHFAGDDTDLFTLQNLSTAWVNTSSTAGTYSTGSDMLWSFTKYGEDVIASNYADPIQKYTMANSATTDFADLNSSDAPDAYYVETVREFLFAANTNDGVDGHQPGRVWWSAQGDHTSWPTPGTAAAAAAQSDFNDFSDRGEITGMVSGVGFADVVILQRGGIRIGNYIGPKAIFRFDVVKAARGCIVPSSVVVQNGKVYYLSDLGFMEFDGNTSRPIALNRIARTFADDADPAYYYRMSAAADPVEPLIFWCVTTGDSTAGLPYKLYIYNWSLDRWSYALCSGVGGVEFVYSAYKIATVEGVPALGVFIDDVTATHDSGFLTGTLATIQIETGDYSGNGRRLDVSHVRPLFDGGSPSSQYYAYLGHRDVQSESVTYEAVGGSTNATAYFGARVNARFIRARVLTTTSLSAGTWNLAQGVEVEVQKVEKRDDFAYTVPS